MNNEWQEVDYLKLHKSFETNGWEPRQYHHKMPKGWQPRSNPTKRIMPYQIKIEGVKFNLQDTKKVGRMSILPKPERQVENVVAYYYRGKTAGLTFLIPELIVDPDHCHRFEQQPVGGLLRWHFRKVPILYLFNKSPGLAWQEMSWRIAVDAFQSKRCAVVN